MRLKHRLRFLNYSLIVQHILFYFVMILFLLVISFIVVMIFHALITYKAPFEAIELCSDFIKQHSGRVSEIKQVVNSLENIESKMLDKSIISFLFQIFTITFITLGLAFLSGSFKTLSTLKDRTLKLSNIIEPMIITNNACLSLNMLFLNLRVFSSLISRTNPKLHPKTIDYAHEILDLLEDCKKRKVGIKRDILEDYYDIVYELIAKIRTSYIKDDIALKLFNNISLFIKENKAMFIKLYVGDFDSINDLEKRLF